MSWGTATDDKNHKSQHVHDNSNRANREYPKASWSDRGARGTRDATDPRLDPLYEEAIRDTIERFEATGSPVITDGEQRKYHNFWTYCVHGLPNTAPDGFKIPFAAGHVRRMPRLTAGPFRYQRHADSYLDVALRYAHVPVKQAVISPSALSLMYPAEEIPGYSREEFIHDLLREHETEVRNCLRKGAHKVQIDFTEGRLAVKIDPSGNLLHSFIDLNNLALSRFSPRTASASACTRVPAATAIRPTARTSTIRELLPSLFELKVGNFYIALAGERDRVRVLKTHPGVHEAGPADFRRRRRADRPAHRDAGGDPGPNPRSGQVHSDRAIGHDGRLRLFAVL